ncbi:MAG: ABC transporter ATP-binding protein, partial [Desulfobulbaceae bacterium]|nr:ABC transporter ATP-binding protein [Desulfobulbaceae bacterium]
GKTTLLRCMAALEHPLSGTIRVQSMDVHECPRESHRMIGYLSDFFGLYNELTVRQCLLHAAGARGISYEKIEGVVKRAAERLQLSDRLKVKAGALSRGLRQRLAIAQAIVHDPEILLLDEPASGLDPEARHSLAELFLALREQGMTLVVSSHILSELDEYSTHMLVLKDGRIVDDKSMQLAKHHPESVTIEVHTVSVVDNFAMILSQLNGVWDVTVNGTVAEFTCDADNEKQHELLRSLIQRDIPVISFTEKTFNIQQAYLNTVQEKTQ